MHYIIATHYYCVASWIGFMDCPFLCNFSATRKKTERQFRKFHIPADESFTAAATTSPKHESHTTMKKAASNAGTGAATAAASGTAADEVIPAWDPVFAVHRLVFSVVERPRFKLSPGAVVRHVSPFVIFFVMFLSYFLVVGGVIYDIIVEPPSIGSAPDSLGRHKPVVIMPGRINSQYIIEGLSASLMICLGSLGFIALEHVPSQGVGRRVMVGLGLGLLGVSWFLTRYFLFIKVPAYLSYTQ